MNKQIYVQQFALLDTLMILFWLQIIIIVPHVKEDV